MLAEGVRIVLNPAIGEAVRTGGRDGIVTRTGAIGHAVFGPYREMQPGRYVVEFVIAAAEDDGAGGPGEICAMIDVTTDYGRTDLAFDYVLGSQLSQHRPIALEFDVAHPCTVEFRVWVNGSMPLVVADAPQVRVRPGTGAPRSRMPSIPVPGLDARFVKRMFERAAPVDLSGDTVSIRTEHLALFAEMLLGSQNDRAAQAQQIVRSVGWRGNAENSLYRAFVGREQPISSSPQPVPFTSTLCQQAHFALDQYRFWARALKETPRFQRKQWEFIYIAQALYERGFLQPGKTGLVFGAGQEPLPALFASFGVKILATDQAAEAAIESGWTGSGQHTYDLSALNTRAICTDRMFSELVSYRSVDMNDIPADLGGQFDFCWSACALEHLGSLRHGLQFIENAMKTLRPGGIAVHTTEYNLSSDEDTLDDAHVCIYRRRDIEGFVAEMEAQGYVVAPIEWQLGEGFAETVIDLPPYAGEPHIRLKAGEFETTSFGLIIGKPV